MQSLTLPQGITTQFKALTNVMMLVILAVTSATSALFFILLESKMLALIAAGSWGYFLSSGS